ncbi:MAG: hypothetical protein ACOX1S_13000 [Anaerostipes sp.]|jgi:hypothetical protein
MKKQLDFETFIKEHEASIFGQSKKLIPCTIRYSKKIKALDYQLNVLIQDPEGDMAQDPILLLGLFAMTIEKFGPGVKTDISLYRDEFIDFITNR